MRIKAIIFDVDGLMVDSEPISHAAWNEFLRPFGHQLTPEFIEKMVGLRGDVSSQMVQSFFNLPLTAPEIQQQKRKIAVRLYAQGVPIMPGLYELIADLERRQLPWGVGTSSPRQHAVNILEQLGLTEVCRAIAAGDEVAHGKPHPDIYQLAAKRMQVPPEACLAFEDSEPGSRAAVAAGLRVVVVPNADTAGSNFSHATAVCPSLNDVRKNLTQFLA